MTASKLNEQKGIDHDKLLERCLGINSFADKLVASFVAALPNERNALRSAMDAADLKLVAQQAHRLRGSASNLCADELSAAAEAVETAARNAFSDSVTLLIDEVELAIDRILNESWDGVLKQ